VSGCETWPLAKLIRHIVERHHTWLRVQFPEIAQLIRQTIAREGHARSGRFLEIEKLFRQFQREMENHLKKEETVLFPLIEKLEARAASGLPPERQSFGPLRNPVQFMTEDHELADRLLAKMKELARESAATQEATAVRQAVLQRIEAVAEDLATHVHLEDEILFPRAIRLEEGAESPAL
jgi:regulator of cell morphogenesis and NO signaling